MVLHRSIDLLKDSKSVRMAMKTLDPTRATGRKPRHRRNQAASRRPHDDGSPLCGKLRHLAGGRSNVGQGKSRARV
jgi:hypothetical protein